jgi:hypothetical protein
MTMTSRRELLAALKPIYAKARKNEKQKLLDGFVAATGYNRKHATVLLNRAFAEVPAKRNRRKKYDEPVRSALIQIWKASNRICSKRLIPFLPTIIDSLVRFEHIELTDEIRAKLLELSAGSADRLLKEERKKYGRRKSTTRPGYLLKKHIPVRTYADWSEDRPGFFEADLVAHGGESASGQFLQTLTITDVFTGWTELVALLAKSEAGVMKGFSDVRDSLPFPLLGLDTDNGSEFINHTILGWCQREKITFTRSREYKKNDQAYVEEKNGSIVRRLIGYDRYEGMQSWQLLASLYSVARLYVNFFQPSLKLSQKEREGGKVTRHYHAAATPHHRLLQSQSINDDCKASLNSFFASLDPVALLAEVERLQKELWATAIDSKPQAAAAISAEQLERIGAISKPRIADISNKPTAPTSKRPRKAERKLRLLSSSYAGNKKGPKTTLDAVWSEVVAELNLQVLSPREIFKFLQDRYPDRIRRTQLSTITDRLLRWRFENGFDLELPKLKPGKKSNVDEVWELALTELSTQPTLSVNKLLVALIERHPGIVRKGHRTSLYERLKIWREHQLEAINSEHKTASAILMIDLPPRVTPKAVTG